MKRKISISAHLLHLPEDQFRNITEYLFLKDVLTLTVVSKECRELVFQSIHILSNAKEGYVYGSSAYLKPSLNEMNGIANLLCHVENLRILKLWNVSSMLMPPVCERTPKLVSLELRSCHHFEPHRQFENMSFWFQDNHTNKNLEKLIFSGSIPMPYEHNFFLHSCIRNSGHRLQHLELNGCVFLNDKNISKILSRARHLQTFKISNCSATSPKIQSETMTDLKITNCSYTFQSLNFNCPLLTHCDLSDNSKLDDGSVKQVINSCPKLRTLLLARCHGIKCIRLDTLTDLQILDLSACNGLEELEMIGDYYDLIDLKMSLCHSLQSVRIEINKSKAFQKLALQSCVLLNNLQIASNSLLSLNISGCSSLSDHNTHVACPCLQVIDACGTSLTHDFYKIVEDLGKCFVKRGALETSISRHF